MAMINSYSSIGEIQSLVRSLDPETRKMSKDIFDVNVYSGISIPSSQIKSSVERIFGSIEAVRSQRIVKIVNKVTSIAVTYNPLFDVINALEKNIFEPVQHDEVSFSDHEASAGPLGHSVFGSITDPFDRVNGKYSSVTGTLVKADVYHGLLVPSGTDATAFSNDVFKDYLRTAWRWIRTVHEYDKAAIYPLIVWNSSFLNGNESDQVFPLEPIELFVGKGSHYAAVERDRKSASLYEGNVSSYYRDLFLVHEALGLGYSNPETKTFVNLTPSVPGSEVTVFSQDISEPLFDEVYHALNMFRGQFKSGEVNLAITSPPLGDPREGWSGFPSISRLVVSDQFMASRFGFNGMDLFGQSVITRDPFVLARALSA